jgi:hypothetical protein
MSAAGLLAPAPAPAGAPPAPEYYPEEDEELESAEDDERSCRGRESDEGASAPARRTAGGGVGPPRDGRGAGPLRGWGGDGGNGEEAGLRSSPQFQLGKWGKSQAPPCPALIGQKGLEVVRAVGLFKTAPPHTRPPPATA